LYELFGVSANARPEDIKRAYYRLQKIFHPDIAGPEGKAMSVLLNDAYETLRSKEGRSAYDETLAVTDKAPTGMELATSASNDLLPTWKWKPQKKKTAPVWNWQPKSYSKWDKVDPESRGEKHYAQQMLFVDEFQCIACRNCHDIAPSTFIISPEHGRARVYAQWGNCEEWLDYAVQSCPVDCIHWVQREELQCLEHVTQTRMFETGGQIPCGMSIHQGVILQEDFPFEMARAFKAKVEQKETWRKDKLKNCDIGADIFAKRITNVLQEMSSTLRVALVQLR
jgi:ferredoxin